MAIGGIGSNNYYGSYGINSSYLNSQASLNEAKLQQVLQKASSRYGTNKSQTESLKTNSMSFLKSYNSTMSDVMSSANSLRDLNSSGVTHELTANSSDTSIVDAKTNYKVRSSDTYDISVQQLAASQINTSTAANSNDLALSDANFDITTNRGTASINVSAVDANGSQKTNKQMLNDVAKEINNQNLGVSASVVEKDGKSTLEIKSNQTGAQNAFTVSGDYAQNMGLTNVSQTAQDAKYSVKTNGGAEQQYTSSSNEISLDYGKITANLKKTGNATVSTGVNDKNIISSMEDLVNSYNSALKVLQNNESRGTGVERQLRSMTRALGSNQDMELLGISKNKDGTLSLNKDKLAKSLSENADLTKDIISGTGGFADTLFTKAQNALTTSSNSLINNDVKALKEESANNSTNFLNMYSRSGAYNTMNYYAIGMMMNYLA